MYLYVLKTLYAITWYILFYSKQNILNTIKHYNVMTLKLGYKLLASALEITSLNFYRNK